MEYLLFDKNAIFTLTGVHGYQSIEYSQGKELVDHFCGKLESKVLPNLCIKYTKDGVLFIGKKREDTNISELPIYCIDLTTCRIIEKEKDTTADLLTVMQKSFRTALKIWDKRPFSFSERLNGTKSILFPFTMPDKRRLVIERSNTVRRLEKRGIVYPLLAYKYNADDPPHSEEIADTKILQKAGEDYLDVYLEVQQFFSADENLKEQTNNINQKAIRNVEMDQLNEGRGEFSYLDQDKQLQLLTESQRRIVESEEVNKPLRIEGAAGTGKTASLILRSYLLLNKYREKNKEFRLIFVTHSESTNMRCREIFSYYDNSDSYLSENGLQSIQFTTLLNYCAEFAGINQAEIVDNNADDAKTYQLMLIENVLQNAIENGRLKTYGPLISQQLRELFDQEKTPLSVLVSMLQHEFSIQIKGRTDCTIDQYIELKPIPNGLPCINKKDKELVFSLFTEYQMQLRQERYYDVDDVTLEALARLNAPVWRRKRIDEGYDYVVADEMHLFNINEQSVFHYLTKCDNQENIPICFALDYSQAIGDRGNIYSDYIERVFGSEIEKKELKTVFRNSPSIANFCAAIAASGTLMFRSGFQNPYSGMQSSFTSTEEHRAGNPQLFMYENDDEMIESLNGHLNEMMRILHCKKNEIAIVSFEPKYMSDSWVKNYIEVSEKRIAVLRRGDRIQTDAFVMVSPYDVNGLEFYGVILLGVDDGRLPQKMGMGDISKHYVMYSAYNLLYLSASRSKFRLSLLGSKVNGISPCLSYAIENKYIEIAKC